MMAMIPLFNRKQLLTVTLLLLTLLFQSPLFAQLEIFIVPNMDKSDTFTKMEPAAKRWFELNRKSDDKEDQNTYKSCKRSESGSSVIVVFQRTWVNRAGEGGADKPERVTDDPTEETTNIQIETIVPAEKELKPADPSKNAAAATAAQTPRNTAALKAKPKKDESRSNFSPLANIPTPSSGAMVPINARATEMAATFIDLTRDESGKTKISKFEAEGAAILEATFDLKIRSLRPGEKGDFAAISGIISTNDTTVDLAGKTIDQMGVPEKAVDRFSVEQFTASIKKHFDKKGVNFIEIDVRHLPLKDKEAIKEYLINNHSKDFHRLITIGY